MSGGQKPQTYKTEKAVQDNMHLMHANPKLFNRKIMGLLVAKAPCPMLDPLTGVLTMDPKRKANIWSSRHLDK